MFATEQAQTFPAGIFQGSNLVINGGRFIQNNSLQSDFTAQGAFDLLKARVAVSAFHDSEQLGEIPRCYPNTREAVLARIRSWVVDTAPRTAWLLWLNGAAGAGKTAIGQSVAELCVEHGVVVASFFFFRADPTRNTLRPLVATLAYQLVQAVPSMNELVVKAISANPLILGQSLETQFKKVIIEPLRQLHLRAGPDWRVLLIVDGVDECEGEDDQTRLIYMLAKFLSSKDLPIIILFGSRAENHLVSAFASRKVFPILLPLPLGHDCAADRDIRLFLDENFAEIKDTHPLSHLLDDDWPSPYLVQELVNKASGQFIHATVAMKCIAAPRAHPARQAQFILGLRPLPAGTATPFAQLDALYAHIFAQAHAPDAVLSILAYSILGHEMYLSTITGYLGLGVDEAHVALADVCSLVVCESEDLRLRFLHKSLPDFLGDETRAGAWHIGGAWGTRLALVGLRNSKEGRIGSSEERALVCFLEHAECTDELREAISAYRPTPIFRTMYDLFLKEYLTAVQKLDFGDGGEIYRQQLDLVTRYVKKEFPSLVYQIAEMHDISAVLDQIKWDERAAWDANALGTGCLPGC